MEGRGFDLNSITVRTEALQVLTSEEAAYYRLLPYDVDAGGRLLCLGEDGRDYADAFVTWTSCLGRSCLSGISRLRICPVCWRFITDRQGCGPKSRCLMS